MAPGADGSAGKKKKKKKGGGDGEDVGCCSVARRDGESDESLTERTDHWRAIIFFTLAIFMVAPLFIIVYMYRSGQTSYGTAFDAFMCFFCLGLLLLLIAAYYARRLFRRGIVFCHRPPVLWTLCIICAIWLLIVGLARDEVRTKSKAGRGGGGGTRARAEARPSRPSSSLVSLLLATLARFACVRRAVRLCLARRAADTDAGRSEEARGDSHASYVRVSRSRDCSLARGGEGGAPAAAAGVDRPTATPSPPCHPPTRRGDGGDDDRGRGAIGPRKVQYHGGLAVRWRARLYLAVLGALCIYFGVMAIVFSRYEIAKAWPDHKLATPLMLLLAALTCGSAAITTANVRDTRGMEHELFKVHTWLSISRERTNDI